MNPAIERYNLQGQKLSALVCSLCRRKTHSNSINNCWCLLSTMLNALFIVSHLILQQQISFFVGFIIIILKMRNDLEMINNLPKVMCPIE